MVMVYTPSDLSWKNSLRCVSSGWNEIWENWQ